MGVTDPGNTETERSEPLQKDAWRSIFSVSPSNGLSHLIYLLFSPMHSYLLLSLPIHLFLCVTHRIVCEVADRPLDEFPCVIEKQLRHSGTGSIGKSSRA